MVEVVLMLVAVDMGLELRIEEERCGVFLHGVDQRRFLGSTETHRFTSLIAAALRDPVEPTEVDEIGEVAVAWVLSLDEAHATFYVGSNEETRMLFVEDAEGGLLARLALDEDCRSAWIETLS